VGQNRRPGVERETPFLQRSIFRTIGRVLSVFRRFRCSPSPSLWCLRRKTASGRRGYERCPKTSVDVGERSAAIEPPVVHCARDVNFGPAVPPVAVVPLHRVSHERCRLGSGEKLLVAELRRTFERRERGKIPDVFEIRKRRSSCLLRSGRNVGGQDDEHEQ
jgi:hypothetical protein